MTGTRLCAAVLLLSLVVLRATAFDDGGFGGFGGFGAQFGDWKPSLGPSSGEPGRSEARSETAPLVVSPALGRGGGSGEEETSGEMTLERPVHTHSEPEKEKEPVNAYMAFGLNNGIYNMARFQSPWEDGVVPTEVVGDFDDSQEVEEVDTHGSPPRTGQRWCMFQRFKQKGYFYFKLAQCKEDEFDFGGRNGMPGKPPKTYTFSYGKAGWAKNFDYDVTEESETLGVWRYQEQSSSGEKTERLAWCRGNALGNYPPPLEDEDERGDEFDIEKEKLVSCMEADLQPMTEPDPTYKELSAAIKENICLSNTVANSDEAITALCGSLTGFKEAAIDFNSMFLSWESTSEAAGTICKEEEYPYGFAHGRADVTLKEFKAFCESKMDAIETEPEVDNYTTFVPPPSHLRKAAVPTAIPESATGAEEAETAPVVSADTITMNYICVNKNSHEVRLMDKSGEQISPTAHMMLFQKMMQVEKGQVCGLRFI